MKPPTYTELLMLRTGVELAQGLKPRGKAVLFSLIDPELTRLKKACRYAISIPDLKPGPWYFHTKAEGEAKRRWLIANIDLSPATRVIPYRP